jgi:LEA14-like dessication related protein
MKKRMIKFTIFIVSAVVLLFVVNTFLCTPTGIAPEIIDVTDIKILELRSDSLKLDIRVLALNRNDSDVEIEDVFLNLIIDTDTIGSAFRSEKITMGRFDTSTVSFYANLYTLKAIKLASKKKDTINLRMKGEVTADLGLITMPVEVDLAHKFDLQKELSETIEKDTKNNKLLNVESAKLNSVSLGESTVEIEFKLTNPYGIDILLQNYPSQIFINENKSGEGNIASEILLQKEKSTADGSVIYELSNVKTISSLFGSILKRKLEYQTNGMLKLKVLGYNIQFPFNFRGELVKI